MYVSYNSQALPRQYQQRSSKNLNVPRISKETTQYCKVLRGKGDSLSNILDDIFEYVNNIQNERQQTIDLKEIIFTLIQTNRSNLSSVRQHEFFTLIPTPVVNLLQQWTLKSNVNQDDLFFFRNIVKLGKAQSKYIDDINLYPSWINNSSLIETIGSFLKHIITSKKNPNERVIKYFLRFFNIYKNYQILIDENSTANQDQLVGFVDSVMACLTSNFYINSFHHLQNNVKKLSQKQKLALLHCPRFFISYRGKQFLKKESLSFNSTIDIS